MLRIRIVNDHLHQKTIQLCFGQGISTFLLYRILCRHNHEWRRQGIGFVSDRNLLFRHGFKQCGLHLCRSPIDFVSENQIIEQGSFLKHE